MLPYVPSWLQSLLCCPPLRPYQRAQRRWQELRQSSQWQRSKIPLQSLQLLSIQWPPREWRKNVHSAAQAHCLPRRSMGVMASAPIPRVTLLAMMKVAALQLAVEAAADLPLEVP